MLSKFGNGGICGGPVEMKVFGDGLFGDGENWACEVVLLELSIGLVGELKICVVRFFRCNTRFLRAVFSISGSNVSGDEFPECLV